MEELGEYNANLNLVYVPIRDLNVGTWRGESCQPKMFFYLSLRQCSDPSDWHFY